MAARTRIEEEVAPAAKKTRRALAELTPEALSFLVAVLRDQGQKTELRMKAAESILDRGCGKASSTQGGEESTGVMTVAFEGALEEWSR